MPDAHRNEIEKLEALYAEHPEGRVFTHLAEAYRKAGELERAREVLEDGLTRHPDYSSAHVVLGRVLVDQASPEEARTEFRRVLELDAHNMVALRALGDLARNDGRTEEALDYYTRLLDVEPTDQDVRDVMAELRGGPAADGGAEEPSPDGVGAASVPAEQEEPPSPHGDPYAPLVADLEEGDEPSVGEPGVTTETIAQVYARQGLYDRAADVYRQLLRNHPDNEALRSRLAEMEELAARAEDGPIDEPPLDPEIGDLDGLYGSDASGGEIEPLPGLEEGPEPGEIVELEPLAGWDEEPATASEEETLAGFESAEVDLDAADVAPLAGLETDEKDPETGLTTDGEFALGGGTPGAESELDSDDAMRPAESDVVAGLDLGPTEVETEPADLAEDPEPTELGEIAGFDVAAELAEDPEPAERGEAAELDEAADLDGTADLDETADIDEPWLSASVTGPEDGAPEAEAAEGFDVEGAEPGPDLETPQAAEEADTEAGSVWTSVDEAGIAEETPYAWAEPAEEEVDGSPPVAEYLRGLLSWSGSPDGGRGAGEGTTGGGDAPASMGEAPSAPAGAEMGEGAAPAASTEPSDREDDDLDTFRSWLESLKQ